MTTSGTTIWNPDLAEMIEEAYERCGIEIRDGYEFRTARRSLNYLLTNWANRGFNMWTVEQLDIPLIYGQGQYNLPADCVDVVEHVIRQYQGNQQLQTDLVIPRIALPTYAAIPNKLSTGRPVEIYVDRQSPIPVANIWPTPNLDSYILHVWYLRRMQDAGQPGTTTLDIPFRFYEAMTAGLAYYLAQKKPEAYDRIGMLKASYDEAWELAAGEDRDKSPVRFIPAAGYLMGRGGW